MSEFISDFIGVFNNPAQTVARAMEKKRWQAALAVILLVTAVCTFATFPVTKAEQAKFVRDSAMAEKLSDEQLANLDKFTPTQRVTGSLTAAAIAALAIVVAAFFIYLFFKVGGAEGLYVNYFSGMAQASLLDMGLGMVLKSVLMLAKKTMLVQTGLTMFFPGLDFRSFSFLLLSQFDFFSIWYLAALALGIAVFAKISPRKSISITILYFAFRALVVVSVSYFAMRLVGM
jgi:predicted phage tail protein